MNALVSWIDSGDHHHEADPEDISREEFERIRRKQNELIERVEVVEAQVRAITAKEKRRDA